MLFLYVMVVLAHHRSLSMHFQMNFKAFKCTVMITEAVNLLKVYFDSTASLSIVNSTFKKKSNLDKEVLIIGAGPSGIDMVFAIAKTAKHITFSHHQHNTLYNYPENVELKGRVQRITKTGAEFDDGTHHSFTNILYCTGTIYKF